MGNIVTFKYDALGRRIEKQFKKTTTHFVWDGNVSLHEYKTFEDKAFDADEVTTWVFEPGRFVPAAKLNKEKKYSISADHLGAPSQMYDEEGVST